MFIVVLFFVSLSLFRASDASKNYSSKRNCLWKLCKRSLWVWIFFKLRKPSCQNEWFFPLFFHPLSRLPLLRNVQRLQFGMNELCNYFLPGNIFLIFSLVLTSLWTQLYENLFRWKIPPVLIFLSQFFRIFFLSLFVMNKYMQEVKQSFVFGLTEKG